MLACLFFPRIDRAVFGTRPGGMGQAATAADGRGPPVCVSELHKHGQFWHISGVRFQSEDLKSQVTGSSPLQHTLK